MKSTQFFTNEIFSIFTAEKKKKISVFCTGICIFYFQKKCEQYWPSQGKNVYGDITVETLDVAEYTDYTIRTFRITEVRINSCKF